MRQDVTVFRRDGHFAGWPANSLCLSWGNEILVGYQVGTFQVRTGHAFDRDRDWYIYLSRSYDGGLTWDAVKTDFFAPAPSRYVRCPERMRPFDGDIDFTDPDLCMLFTMSGKHNDDYSWWQYSTDRGHTWDGPFMMPKIPGFDVTLNMRTQYIVRNKSEIYLFLTCQRSVGTEGRVACAIMKDGGKSIEFLGYVGDEIPGDSSYSIMPQARIRRDGTIVCLNRVIVKTETDKRFFIDQYSSRDGKDWVFERHATELFGGSNPGSLVVMQDGTWVLMYGSRGEPFGIRLKYSENEGRDWSDEIILRDDGGCKDLGYPRATVRGDGCVVVCYYFSKASDALRTIEGTIFDKQFLLDQSRAQKQ